MTNLHITNGDGAANLLKASSVSGDVLPWRDPMHHGPFPAGLDLDALSQKRARYLAESPTEADAVMRDFELRDDHLRAAGQYERVILWFEHDLLDQLQVLQLLDWFADIDLGHTRLEMICINRFPGIEPFRGIGQLDTKQVASLQSHAEPVASGVLELAVAGWSAFRSGDPNTLVKFLADDLSALPFLYMALARHLEEYPAFENGLTRTEMQILKLVNQGVVRPDQLFVKNMDFESALFIGDWPTYGHIASLCTGRAPLMMCESGETFWQPRQDLGSTEDFLNQRLRLTDSGRAAAALNLDVFRLIERNCWLGGVHLNSREPMWTWDNKHQQLKLRAV